MKEIALRITGADDGEIEADTPLMEAGLTSNSVRVPGSQSQEFSDGLNCQADWTCMLYIVCFSSKAIIMRDVPWPFFIGIETEPHEHCKNRDLFDAFFISKVFLQELSQALPGVQLPVTLVFDYPSVSAMTELILQSTGAPALKN